MKPSKASPYPLLNLLVFSIIIIVVVILTPTLISTSTTTTTSFGTDNTPQSSTTPLLLLSSSSSVNQKQQPTTLHHIAFGIASSKKSWPVRKDFVKLWWNNQQMKGCVFLDEPITATTTSTHNNKNNDPPLCTSQETSRFPYTYRNGHRSAIRIARIVSETVNLTKPLTSSIRWFVFGDDDTLFFPENLAKTLAKYDHELWYYVGSNSETFEQNRMFSFEMAFGGAGFAISAPLARSLSRVFDSCLERYPHLYGSDGRVYSCLAELGVGLTHEPGFHQMDVRGDLFGLLASHPLTPVVSLHHLNNANPIFSPTHSTVLESVTLLYRAAQVDQTRLLQQTVCYDIWYSWTVSVSWGYAVVVHEGHHFLPDALRSEQSFSTWKRSDKGFMFDTRSRSPDPCRRATVFFFDGVLEEEKGSGAVVVVKSRYKMTSVPGECKFDPKRSPKKLKEIVVLSRKADLSMNEMRAPRRDCCDVLPPDTEDRIEIQIRKCKEDELTYMHP